MEDYIYDGSKQRLAEDIRWSAGLFGLERPDLTAYALRRGGATWHFKKYASFDSTASVGRWEQVRFARIYIQCALADALRFNIPGNHSR